MAKDNGSVRAKVTFGLAITLLIWQTAARAQTAPPALLLSPNQTLFGRGATLDVTLGLGYAGPTLPMDLHFGVVLPDGDSVIFFEHGGGSTGTGRLSDLRSLRPMLRGLAVGGSVHLAIPAFFHYVWQGFEPLGRYRFYFAALRPGALGDGRIDGGELLALQTADIENRAPAAVTVDPSHATGAVVPITGGTVTATAADGTTYRLDVPPGALARPTAITLTPVTTMTGVPGQFQGIRAVRAEPEGLTFGVPATLTIHPPTASGSGGLLGFSTTSGGAGLDLNTAVRLPTGDLVLPNVSHFSVLGAGVPGNLAELNVGAATSGAAFMPLIVATQDRAVTEALLTQWFDTLVFPQVVAGAQDPAAFIPAMREFAFWDAARVIYGNSVGVPNGGLLESRSTLGKFRVNAGAMLAMDDFNARCVATQQVGRAEDVLRIRTLTLELYDHLTYALMQVSALHVPIFPSIVGLDSFTVLGNLCIRVAIGSATFPPPVAGVTAPVTVQAGLRFTNGTVAVAPPLQVRVDAISATPSQRVGLTDATGRFTANFTPTSTGATLDILATLIDAQFPYLTDATLTDTRRLAQVGAVVVTPPQTTILAGQSRQFSAVVEGTTNQAVTWSVSGGGTITTSGLFTSNGNAGVFFVTATSVADTDSVGIAQVTVQGGALASLDVSASTGPNASTCTPPVSLPAQPPPLSGQATCTIPDLSGQPVSVATIQLSVGATATSATWQASANTNSFLEVDTGLSANGGSQFSIVPRTSGAVQLNVATAGFTGTYFVQLQASYKGQTAAARYLVNSFGQVVINEPTVSLPIVSGGPDRLVVNLTLNCSAGCVGAGTVATVSIP